MVRAVIGDTSRHAEVTMQIITGQHTTDSLPFERLAPP
jgi:hypothetical protein